MRKFFGGKKKLHKSQSAHEDSQNRISDAKPGTSANGILLTLSRTFDASRGYRSVEFDRSSSGYRSSADENRFDPELDKSMMQTITDVKYVNTRPKFTAVVDANFQRQCLEAHNIVRHKYGSPALIWSQELADLAKTWAIKLADRGRILYPELPGICENIHLVSDETGNHLTTGSELVALWASEAEYFDFSNPRWNLKCKHFSQLLWRSSIEMGVARYWNTTKNCLAIVAFYRPGGNSNAPGEFAINLPSKSEVPEDARSATQLESLIQSLNRATLNDGFFLPTTSSTLPRNSSSTVAPARHSSTPSKK
ncbi:cysteine-rich secretory protein family domain-containing protein [Ditylenchus destructor]|uniref:Cysteine-rich secretory protein family domain-containing protein n=1 Tax=Ditylenchus destructor TaxID=166010 RepID=A0AAD4RBB9_9BILA|nr:cysteine-rich secretory protein family domain-containing protein [Ditylenchus destructor]